MSNISMDEIAKYCQFLEKKDKPVKTKNPKAKNPSNQQTQQINPSQGSI